MEATASDFLTAYLTASSTKSSHCCSELQALAQRTFSRAILPSTPYRSATALTRSGRNVPLISQLSASLGRSQLILAQCRYKPLFHLLHLVPLASGLIRREYGTIGSEISLPYNSRGGIIWLTFPVRYSPNTSVML